jgi:hypothetical protein
MPIALLIYIIFLNQTSYSYEIDENVEKLRKTNILSLPDNRMIKISYHNDHFKEGTYKIRIHITHQNKTIWDKTYGESLGELWYGASFIPLYKNQFYADLNHDGNLEFAIAIEHGGNAVYNSRALIFTLINNQLILLKKEKINIESSRWIYQSHDEFYKPH